MFELPTKTPEETYQEYLAELRVRKNQLELSAVPQGSPVGPSTKTPRETYQECLAYYRARKNGAAFPIAQQGSPPPPSQKAHTCGGNLRMEVLLALRVMYEAGPTKVAKQISQWRGQPVGRNSAGEHLVKLRKAGYVIGKKRKLNDTGDRRFVNAHAYATYSLTDKGWGETEEIMRWMNAVRDELRLQDDPFC